MTRTPFVLCATVASAVVCLFVQGAAATSADLGQQFGYVFVPTGANLALTGANAYDYAGTSVASAGDVNGDGLADVVVGASGASNNGRRSSGSVYVAFGQAGQGSVGLGSQRAGGFRIDGADAYDDIGESVASVGDVNGDGRPDLLVGGYGEAYVVFGKATPGNVDLASLGDGGFRMLGSTVGSVAHVGDLNDDGRADMLLGAPYAATGGRMSSGAAYVIFGRASTGDIDLSALGDAGFRIEGASAYDYAGESVGGIGDLNGDGRPDLLIGAPYSDAGGAGNSGSVYVVFGKATPGDIDLAELGSGGFRIDGANPYDNAGNSVAGIGDMNGDERPDVLIGAEGASNNGRRDSGSAYVVYGKASTDNVKLASLGSSGYRVDGANAGDRLGTSVSTAGDVNGDGLPDFLVGMDGSISTGAYAVFGQSNPANVDLAALGSHGFWVAALRYDQAGRSVAAAGDVNGDARPDIVVGAPGATADQANAGAAYVLYGFGTPELSYAPLVAVAGKPGVADTPTVHHTGATRFVVTPHLPAGLTLDRATGAVSGTPAQPGTRTTYTVTMTDLVGVAHAQLEITIKDMTAPTLTVRARRPQQAVHQGGVVVAAACNEACNLTASGTVSVAGSTVVIGFRPARTTLRVAGATTLKLTLSAGGLRRLGRLLGQHGRGRATVTVRAVDRSGNATSSVRAIALRP